MRKPTPFIILLVLAVTMASLYCCCLTEQVEAKSELPPCHQQADDTSSQPENECECTQIQSLAISPSFGVVKPHVNEVETFDIFAATHSSITYQHELQLLLVSSFENSDSSPTPLYLKHSNLRL